MEMEKYSVRRDGLPPISFIGECIACNNNSDHNSTRWTEVRIWRTLGGKFVAAIVLVSQWEDEGGSRRAASRDTPAEIIDWLKGGEDALGRVSQEAVEAAAKCDPSFAAAWVEAVE